MTMLHNIKTVARTEAKMFARSWLFRFLMVFTVVVIGFFSWLMFIMNAVGWMMRSIPSSLPYFVSLTLAIFQSLLVIFGSVESMHRDRRLNTFASLHTRDISNFGYLTGKIIGILKPCAMLSVLFLFAAATMNLFFMDYVPFVLADYIIYPVLILVPALVFITGLSFLVTALVKSKPLALLILIGYFALTFLYRDGIFARVIDFMAIHQPLLSSTIIGFSSFGSILLQRGMFIFFGIASILGTGIVFERLPQSLSSIRVSRYAAIACIAVAFFAVTLFANGINRGIHLRERIVALNNEYVTMPRARLTACDLDIVHNGSNLDVEATLTLKNHRDKTVNSIVFSLNPGFKVRSVTDGGTDLAFTRDTQIIEVALPSPLEPGDTTVLAVSYDGTIDNNACYPDIDDADRIRTNRVFTYVADRQYGFIRDDYVLLTPECQWYPSSGIPYGLIFPDAYERDFVDFSIDITTRDDLTAISQGAVEQTGTGRYTIRPEMALPGLSLAVGDYEKRSVDVDGVEVALYNQKGNFFFKTSEPIEPSAVAAAIKSMKVEYEANKKMYYAYPRFYVIESPLQFHAYERPWKTYIETSQPQLAIVPERGFFISRIREDLFDLGSPMQSFRSASRNELPSVIDFVTSNFRIYLYDVFMSDRTQRESARAKRSKKPALINPMFLLNPGSSYIPGYSMSAQYYPHLVSFESDTYPVFNTIMEFYRKHGLNTNTNITSRTNKPLFDEEIVCMALDHASFRDYLRDGTDFDTMNLLLMLKANHLFGAMQAEIGDTGFDAFLNEYINEHAFESITYEQFAAAVEERFVLNMDDIFETWFSDNRLPLFEVNDVSVTEIVQGAYTYYQTILKVSNTEPVPGTMWVQVRLGGSGNAIERATRFITLAGHQTKEVGFVTDTPPPDMEFNGIVSKNLPLVFARGLGTPREDHGAEPFEGERIVPYSPNVPSPGTIVVDNLDAGFELVSDPADIDDGDYTDLYKYGEAPNDFISPMFSLPPKRWGKAVVKSAYGAQKIALFTKGGSGDGKVVWHAEIPEAGRYDLEYFIYDPRQEAISGSGVQSIPGASISANGELVLAGTGPVSITYINGQPVLSQGAAKLFEDYHLTITNSGQATDITYMPNQNQPGWQYVSTMDLEAGQTDVCLCNKSEGVLIYADAIRWVKK